MDEKFSEKALKHYQKGEKHLASGKYKKCESEFSKAIDFFMKAGEIERSEKVNLKLCECYIIEKKYYEAAQAAAQAAELILRHSKFKNAIKHYQSVIDFYEKVDATLEMLEIYSLIALSYIAQGNFHDGRSLLEKKVAKSTLPQIKKNKIIQFAALIVNTILKKDSENIEEIKWRISKMKVGEGILQLFKTVEDITRLYVDTIVTISPDRAEIRAGDEVQIKVDVKRPADLEIVTSELGYDRLFDLVEEETISADKRVIEFKVRPRIQGKLKIGPISLICKTAEFQFPLKIQKTIKVLPGVPKLIIRAELPEIRTNVGNAVPITLVLINEGKGECMNLNLQLKLPEEIDLVEGTTEKMLHSLGSQEEFSFTFRVMANEKIETPLSATLTYEDLEANKNTIEIESIKFIAEG